MVVIKSHVKKGCHAAHANNNNSKVTNMSPAQWKDLAQLTYGPADKEQVVEMFVTCRAHGYNNFRLSKCYPPLENFLGLIH